MILDAYVLTWIYLWLFLFTAPIVYEMVLDWLIFAAESISENCIIYYMSVEVKEH